MEEQALICCRCNEELRPMKAVFNYMGFTINETLPCCPKCGFVYISEELAAGKILEVEEELEEK